MLINIRIKRKTIILLILLLVSIIIINSNYHHLESFSPQYLPCYIPLADPIMSSTMMKNTSQHLPFVDPIMSSTTMQDVFTMAHESENKYVYRDALANMYLKGFGIEIGAKQAKQKLPKTAKSLNVDHMSTEDLIAKYHGDDKIHKGWIAGIKKNPVDRVDDAGTLETFDDDSLDFIIANHVLEHVPNFLGTLEVFAHKLRLGGIAFIALPDKRFVKEDINRPITSPDLFLEELEQKSLSQERFQSKKAEALLYRRMKPGQTEFSDAEKERAMEAALKDVVGGTHIHAFTSESLAMTFAKASMSGFPLRLVLMQQNSNENILILRKSEVTATSKDSSFFIEKTIAKRCYATSLAGSKGIKKDASCPKDVHK